MKDCKLVMTVKNNRVGMEGENISIVELLELCGVLQVMAGKAAQKRGMDIEDVKDNMLDVHLAAMQGLKEEET